MSRFKHVTSQAAVDAYEATNGVFDHLLEEIRQLSKKKPEATLSPGKVKMINKVLDDLLTFLKDEPEGKYLERLSDDELPQTSDALLMMAQFESALSQFHSRYYQHLRDLGVNHWITTDFVHETGEDVEEDGDEEAL